MNLEKYHIPLIYGTNELKYASFISNINSFLFDNHLTYEAKITTNIYKTIKEHDTNIITKIDKNIIYKQFTEKNNPDNLNDKEKIFSTENKLLFLFKFISKIFDENANHIFGPKDKFREDDLINFSEHYILNGRFNFIFYNLLNIDLILYCYLFYPKETERNINKLAKMYESEIIKEKKIKYIQKMISSEIEIYIDETNYFEQKIIKFTNDDDSFEFNPYEYIMENIDVQDDFQEFKKQFKNEENFSIYRNYKYNHLFENNILENEYKENIFQMLTSDVIGEAFDEFIKFKPFRNPFKGNNSIKILEQINNVKYYITFPINKISGITFKKIGIIFINKIFKNMNNINNINQSNKLTKFSINIGNKKVTECHEILAHYMLTICYANKRDTGLLTTENTFSHYIGNKAYCLSKYDGGDRLESIMFGNKIIYLTIQSALYILNENNWNNISIDEFKNKFIELNTLQKNKKEVDLSQESKLIKLIKNNININKTTDKIIIQKKNSFIVFKKGFYIQDIDGEIFYSSNDDEEEEEEEEYYEAFSFTSNAFLPKKVSIASLIKEYGS